MFQGTTIDELINSVERAEQNAHKQQNAHQQSEDAATFSFHEYPLRRAEWQELTEVA